MLLMDWIRATFCMSWRLLKKYKEIIIYVLVGCQDVDDQINDKLKLFLKNVSHHGWATKKSLGSRSS